MSVDANINSINAILGQYGNCSQNSCGNRSLYISIPNLTPAEARKVAEAVRKALEN